MEYPFTAIILKSTLIQSDGTCSGPIYVSNKSVEKLFVLDGNTWHPMTVYKLFLLLLEGILVY